MPGKSPAARDPSFAEFLNHYKVLRAYVEHEDELINNRLLWNLTVQGFLFAAYGFSVQKLVEMENDGAALTDTPSLLALHATLVVLPILGFYISLYSRRGVNAAQIATLSVNRLWVDIRDNHYPASLRNLLPELIGAGDPRRIRPEIPKSNKDALRQATAGKITDATVRWGFEAPYRFPRLFMGAWASVAAAYVAAYVPHLLWSLVSWLRTLC